MKTIQCAHPPHDHNGFVATCRLWTASGGKLKTENGELKRHLLFLFRNISEFFFDSFLSLPKE